MTEFRADLHCHTTCSDGTVTPEEIILLAAKIGLRGLSITDHDTVSAYEQAVPAAEKAGIELISGVEFSASHRDISVHILAYAFSLSNEHILSFCRSHQERRHNRNKTILKLLAKHGMPIEDTDLLGNDYHTIGRPHIAQAMVKKGYVSSIQDAFNKYLKEGGPCYAAGDVFSVEETLDVIHQANGLAFIAHPHLINNERLIRQLLEMPFDGLEGYYARFQPSQEERWVKIAKKKGWLITGGSDFHGTVKEMIPLGCSWVNEEIFRKLQAHYQKNAVS